MHKLKLKRLRFSNLLSYGNNVNEVDFQNGITWISGPNGAGKSTIVEALTLAWFNTPYRNINKPNLKNTANKSKTYVEVEFERIDNKGTDTYILSRTMDGKGSTSTSISKNGELDKKAAGTSQKKIEEEILGFNKTLFENVISLNTIKTVPFIDMDAKDKRKLIESILTLCLDKWKDSNSVQLKEAKTKFESATSDVVKYTKDLGEMDTIILQMEQERDNDIATLESECTVVWADIASKEKEIEEATKSLNDVIEKGKEKKKDFDAFGDVDTELDTYNTAKVVIPQIASDNEALVSKKTLLDTASTELNKLKADCEKIDIKSLKSRLIEVNSQITKQEKRISVLQTEQSTTTKLMDSVTLKAKELKSGIPCITCGKPSTDADIEKIKENYRIEWNDHKNKKAEIVDEIKVVESSILEFTNEKQKLNESIELYDIVIGKYNEYNVKTYTPIKTDVDTLVESIKTKTQKIQTLGENDVSKIEKIISDLNSKKTAKKIVEDALNGLRSDMAVKKTNKISLDTALGKLNTQKDALVSKIEEKKKIDSNVSITSTKKKRDDINTDLGTAKVRVLKYSDEIEITKYINVICSDEGVKKIVLGIFVPTLNKAIAENLRLFSLPYGIEFDDAMNYRFSSRFGMSEVYEGLSEGQKRKLNFAIAMAFRDFVFDIADFNINTMFLDEVLDISTDPEALRDMLTLIRNNITRIGSVYLITHRGPEVSDCFDNKLEVMHDGRYSSLKQVKLVASNTNY